MADEVLKMEARMENFITKEMDRIQTDLKKFKDKSTEAFQKANKEGGILKNGMKSLKGGIGQLATSFAIGTLAVDGIRKALRKMGETVKFVIDTNIKFEKTLSRVKAILRPTTKEFAALTARARQLGESTIFTASQVGEAFTEMGKLGQDASEIIAGSAAVLDLAALSQTEMSRAATTTVQTLNQFNLTADKSNEIVDIMAKSFNTTALDMEKFTNSMKFVGAVAGSTGESVASVTATLGTMADSGIEASLAGTSLRRIMLELADASSKASKIVMQYDANATSLAEKFKALNKAGLDVTATTDMFGLRATTAAQVLIRNADQVDRLTRSFENADGVAKEFAATMLDNVAGATIRLKSAQEELALTLGESMEPILRGYKEGLIKIFKWLTANEKATKGFKFAFEQMKIDDSLTKITEIMLQQVEVEGMLRILRKEMAKESATWAGLEGFNARQLLTFTERQLELEKQLRVAKGLAPTKVGGLKSSFEQQAKQRKAETAAALLAAKERNKELTEGEEKALANARRRFFAQQKEIQAFQKQLDADTFAAFQEQERRKESFQQLIFASERIARNERIAGITNDEIQELAMMETKYDALKEIVDLNEEELGIIREARTIEANAIITKHKKKFDAEDLEREKQKRQNLIFAGKSLLGSLATLAKLGISQSTKSAKEKQQILLGIAIAETAASVVTAAKAGFDTGVTVFDKIALAIAAGAAAAAIGAVEISTIAAQKFAKGGIVGGNSPAGDKNLISANSDEMVLTKSQQAELFNIANGGGNTTNNSSAFQLTINLPGGGTIDSDNTDRIVGAMENLSETLLEANRGGYLETFKEELKLG